MNEQPNNRQTPEPAHNNTPKEISWDALEFQEYRKHPLWFVFFAVVIAFLVLYGIYTKSWTTATLFALMGILGILYAGQKPKVAKIKLTGAGININTLHYSHRVIKKFWIIYHPPEIKELHFETNAYLNRFIKIELMNQDPNAIREFLKKYVEEDLDAQESLADSIARRIRF